jgi:hypothetical protein
MGQVSDREWWRYVLTAYICQVHLNAFGIFNFSR